MTDYRIYFLDRNGKIAARLEFPAENDAEAMLTANNVSDSCADAHYGHELWSDNRRLKTMRTNLGLPRVALRQLDPPRQRIVLDLEETLQKTRWHIAHSRRLLEATTRLKDLVGSA